MHFLLPLLLGPVPQGLIIDRNDFNYALGTSVEFRQYANLDLGGSILPFDPNAGFWDFSAYGAGQTARVEILDPNGTPYDNDFPSATGCSKQSLPGQSPVFLYERQSAGAHLGIGFGTTSFPFTITAEYDPEWAIFSFPMYLGRRDDQTIRYSYRLGISTVNVTETHDTEVVASGTVRLPGVAYDLPCLVLHETFTYRDNFFQTDNFHGYYWVVPEGFAGGNGVAALQSNTNASAAFTVCRNAFFLGANNLTPDPITLRASAASISQSAGGVIDFTIDAGSARAGRPYLLLGTAAGSAPGYALPGGSYLPLNVDVVTSYIYANLNGPQFQRFRGTLDAQGRAAPRLDSLGALPPFTLGWTLEFAFTTETPYDFQSQTVRVAVVP